MHAGVRLFVQCIKLTTGCFVSGSNSVELASKYETEQYAISYFNQQSATSAHLL